MTIRTVDEDIRLIPYYRNDAASLPWYQDLDVCKQVDDRDTPYDAALLHRCTTISAPTATAGTSSTGARWWGISPCAPAARSPLWCARRTRTGTSGGGAADRHLF